MKILVSLLLCGCLAAQAQADERLDFPRCLDLAEQMAQYEALRRGGGSVAEMDRWKRARRIAQEAFRRGDCRRFRQRLRRRERES